MSAMSCRKRKSTGVGWMQRVPLGIKFHPTDMEAFAYLFSKIYLKHLKLLPLELDLVQELDVYGCEPCKLPRKKEDEFAYYFTPRAHKSEQKIDRYTRDDKGYWRMSGTILKPKTGKKNTLVYYHKSKHERGKDKGHKTNWIMHEYVLDTENSSDESARSLSICLVLCRIYERKVYKEKEDGEMEDLNNGLDLPGLLQLLCESHSQVKKRAVDEGDLDCDFDNNATLLYSPTDDQGDTGACVDLRMNYTQQSCTRNLIQYIDTRSINASTIAEENDIDLSLRL